jgi:hypothetical protein
MPFAKRMLIPVLCIGLAMSAAACGKKAAETPSAQPAPLTVTGLDLGRNIGGDKRVSEKVTDFHPNDVIYASVLTSGASQNAVLRARWTYENGQLVDETEQAIAPTGDAATEFHVSKPDGWPAGKYKIEVFLNGTPAQSKDFEVK